MKTKQVIFTLLCLLLFAAAGNSQPATPQQEKERHKNILRSSWNASGVNLIRIETLFHDPGFRAALGISDEYYQEVLTKMHGAAGRLMDNPEYMEAERELEETRREFYKASGIPANSITPLIKLREGDEEQLKALNRFQEAGGRVALMIRAHGEASQKHRTVAFADAIPPELKQKIQEAHLATIGETSFSLDLFEALYVTDAQRQQMERIKKELEPEFEKHLEIYGKNAVMIIDRVNAALKQKREAGISSDKNPQEELDAFMKNLEAEPEHKRLLDESYASAKAFAVLFRSRMRDVLTDEQRKRFQALYDNPPPHVRYLTHRFRREQWGQGYEEREDKNADVGRAGTLWVPGPDSWKPGDPLPEAFRQERDVKRDFPRLSN